MKTLLAATLAALAFAANPATAQEAESDEAQVLATVTAFMTAFDAKDADAMTALLVDDAYLAYVRESEGGDPVGSAALRDLATGMAQVPAEIAEPIDVKAVMVDGPVAMVWADYGFYMDGEQSHCGVDIFTLMRVANEWKIATVTYSHIEQPCEDAPRP